MRYETDGIEVLFGLFKTYREILIKLEKLYGKEILEQKGFYRDLIKLEDLIDSLQEFDQKQSAGPRFSG